MNFIIAGIGLLILSAWNKMQAKGNDTPTINNWDTGNFRQNILQWRNIINEELVKFPKAVKKLSEIDILTFIYVESAGNPNATAKDGEHGLMQVIERFAYADAVNNGRIKDYSYQQMIHSPRLQINAGIAYLDVIIEKLGESTDLRDVVRSYNGGYGRFKNGETNYSQAYVDNWLSKREKIQQWQIN